MKSILKTITKENLKKSIPYFIVVLIVVVLDQWSKMLVVDSFRLGEKMQIIDGFLQFTHVRNTGAAFSFGDNFPDVFRVILFKIVPVIAGLFFAKMLVDQKESKIMLWAYTLILGGGAGNVIDRIRLDYVVDFISVYHNGIDMLGFKPWYFAIFNIADSAVSIAACLIIIDVLIKRKEDKAHTEEESPV